MGGDGNINQLEVSRAAFVEELRCAVKVLGRRDAGEALIHAAECLVIRVAGAEFALPARGNWSGKHVSPRHVWVR